MSLNMDEKITIKNLCDFYLHFHRLNGIGDVAIPPKSPMRIDRGEVIFQAQNGNRMFIGEDGLGGHASIYIDDKATRVELEFETEEKPQAVISDAKVKEAFAVKSKAGFKKAIEELAHSYGEKVALVKCVKKLGLNEYDKIKFIEEYTGLKVED